MQHVKVFEKNNTWLLFEKGNNKNCLTHKPFTDIFTENPF